MFAVVILLTAPLNAACPRGDMIEDKLEHGDPVAHLTASETDRVGQFFVCDWCFGRLVGHGGAFRLRNRAIFCREW
jgi:hypothetical protein